MKKYIRFSLALTAATAIALPMTGIAAADGNLGESSTGTTEIIADIPHQVLLKNVNDIAFEQADFVAAQSQVGGGITKTDTVCVYSNAGGYTVTAIGSGIGGEFTLANGSHLLPFGVMWYPAAAGGTGVGLIHSSASQNFTNVSTDTNCAVDNARYDIFLEKDVYDQLPAGGYQGTIQIVINPPAAEEA